MVAVDNDNNNIKGAGQDNLQITWANDNKPNLKSDTQNVGGSGNAQNSRQGQQKTQNNKPFNKNMKIIPLMIIAIIIAAVLIYVIATGRNSGVNPTTTILPNNGSISTITTFQQKTSVITSCTTITNPGVYVLHSNITTNIKNGTCIEILSNNVQIDGNNNHISGSGPYINIRPYTYGIFISDVSNVTLTNLNISKFSYSIYLNKVTSSNLNKIKSSNSTLSNIFLNNSSTNIIDNSTIYGSQSASGGINIENGGNNKVIFSTIINNADYGLYLNSSGNSFEHDVFLQNPTDMMCGINANLKNSNNFLSTSCASNNYCNFAQCSRINQVYNIQNIRLSNRISSCGSINTYGTYNVSGNLNLGNYINVSTTESPCIVISSPNVRLNCNGNTISNGYYGILLNGEYNTSIENCNFNNDTYGVLINSSIDTYLSNLNTNSGRLGIYIKGSTNGTVENSTEMNNNIGIYENDSTGFKFKNDNTSQNIYGTYINGGQSNKFSNINTKSNSGGDFYCSANSYSSTSIGIANNLTCGTTDCNWASTQCKTLLPPPLTIIPISACGNINVPGSYQLENNVTSQRTCFTIDAPNVKFNCNNNGMIGSNGYYGIINNGESNVSVENCNIKNYDYGVYVNNAQNVNLENTSIGNVNYGVIYENIKDGSIGNVNITTFKNLGINVSRGNGLSIKNNIASYGLGSSSGFVLSDVNSSVISGNNGQNDPKYGFALINAFNNTVDNNKGFNDGAFGYYCNDANSGIYTNKIGINSGINKFGCMWLIEINPDATQSCFSFSNSGIVTFESDMVYSYGNTCFNINNENKKITNNTVINCNGHTIYATNGGSFANVNASDITIENCYLDNFTTAIIDTAPHLTLYNITITRSNTGIQVSNKSYVKTNNLVITNSTYGIKVNTLSQPEKGISFARFVSSEMKFSALF